MAKNRFWRLMGEMVETGVAYAALAGAAAPSPYVPDVDAQLIGLRLICSRQAATSLINAQLIQLICTTFMPNTIHVAVSGIGLSTAPSAEVIPIDYEVNQPVKAGVPITLQGRNTYANAVTPDTLVLGLFEVN